MEPLDNSGLIGFLTNYNPFTRDGDAPSEAEQMLSNGTVWSLFPAYCELFIESEQGKVVFAAFALGMIEQFAENRLKIENPVARRLVPLATSSCVLGGALLILTKCNPREYTTVAAVTAIGSLTLSAIKAVTNKPYPSIMPFASKMASHLPIVGHHFKEKEKLF